MTATDPFASSDAAYVLGALDADERRAFEAHLETCADCRARVEELRGPAAALALLPRLPFEEGAIPAVDDGPPETLLPALLRRAGRERSRRRWLTAGLGMAAAACLAGLAVVLWPAGKGTSGPPPAALTAVRANPLVVTARLLPREWGTQIDLHCKYPSSDDHRYAYSLVVIDKRNEVHEAGDWTLVPGKAGVDFTGGTAVRRQDIDRVEVRTLDGVPLLRLDL